MKTEMTKIKPEQLIGTKWHSWCDEYRDRMSVEFIDTANCIYTSQPWKYPIPYTVEEGKIFIGSIEGPFELVGNILYNNDLPVFEKAA